MVTMLLFFNNEIEQRLRHERDIRMITVTIRSTGEEMKNDLKSGEEMEGDWS